MMHSFAESMIIVNFHTINVIVYRKLWVLCNQILKMRMFFFLEYVTRPFVNIAKLCGKIFGFILYSQKYMIKSIN